MICLSATILDGYRISELNKFRSYFNSYFMINYAGVPSFAKL